MSWDLQEILQKRPRHQQDQQDQSCPLSNQALAAWSNWFREAIGFQKFVFIKSICIVCGKIFKGKSFVCFRGLIPWRSWSSRVKLAFHFRRSEALGLISLAQRLVAEKVFPLDLLIDSKLLGFQTISFNMIDCSEIRMFSWFNLTHRDSWIHLRQIKQLWLLTLICGTSFSPGCGLLDSALCHGAACS